jgi:hypothetical protein
MNKRVFFFHIFILAAENIIRKDRLHQWPLITDKELRAPTMGASCLKVKFVVLPRLNELLKAWCLLFVYNNKVSSHLHFVVDVFINVLVFFFFSLHCL